MNDLGNYSLSKSNPIWTVQFEQSGFLFFFFFIFFSAGAKSVLVHVNTGRLALGEANAGAKWSVKCSPCDAGLWLLLLLWESLVLSLARLLLIALIEKVTYIWERLLVDQQNSWRTCRGRAGWWNEWGRNLERREKKNLGSLTLVFKYTW